MSQQDMLRLRLASIIVELKGGVPVVVFLKIVWAAAAHFHLKLQTPMDETTGYYRSGRINDLCGILS